MNKKILVVSHERSGTHFLINTIADCFGYSREVVNVHDEYKLRTQEEQESFYLPEVKKFLKAHYKSDETRIFKSHHDIRFFDPDVFEYFNVFYIHRNVLDTLTSCYHYYKMHSDIDFPFDPDIDRFLFEVKPYMHARDRGYSFGCYPNNIVRWETHVRHWLNADVPSGSRICYITYENLVNDFGNQVYEISNFLNKKPIRIKKPGVAGVAPRLGVVGDHKNLFTERQVKSIARCLSE